ncbi:MAG TPA: OmpH family outer membrane protein [Candidatus Polarisedimenticolaceae bacterium]
MSKTVGLTLAAFTLAALPAFAQGATKIAVFDAGRISEETDEGKRIAGQLTSLQDKKRAELQEKQKKVADIQQQLQAQALSLSAEKRQALEKEGQKLALELNQAQESARNELQIEVQEAQNRFQNQLLQVVEQFGRDEGFDLILEKSLVAYAASSIDVTTALVDRFNKLIPAPAAAAPKPAAPAPKKP